MPQGGRPVRYGSTDRMPARSSLRGSYTTFIFRLTFMPGAHGYSQSLKPDGGVLTSRAAGPAR